MKRFAVFVLLMFAAFAASAAPFVRATVAAGTASCGFYLDTGAVVVVPATGTICQFDVATVAQGVHVVTADARSVADPLWGTQTTAKGAPLNFSRPATVTVPVGLALVP